MSLRDIGARKSCWCVILCHVTHRSQILDLAIEVLVPQLHHGPRSPVMLVRGFRFRGGIDLTTNLLTYVVNVCPFPPSLPHPIGESGFLLQMILIS